MKHCIGNVEEIIIEEQKGIIYFTGYCFLEKIDIEKNSKVKKSLLISNENKKYYVPTENIYRHDITEVFGEYKYNYDYSGFSGFIDISFIDNMKPLDNGKWKVSIYLNANGFEIEHEIGYICELKNKIENNKKGMYFSKSNKTIELKLENNKIYLDSRNEEAINEEGIYESLESKGKISLKNSKQKLGHAVYRNLYKIIKKFKIKENRITFLSDSRVTFTGNFEFIHKEILDKGTYEIKSLLKPRIDAKKNMKEKLALLYYLSTSKYIVLDDYYPQIYRYDIKPEVEVIQLWHACGAFKTFGFSRLGKVGGPNPKSRNHKNYTKVIVSSNDIKKHYAEAFGISEDKVIATGVPRTDIFFDEKYKKEKSKEIYEKYPILKHKKVILFAPTFRGSGQKSAHYDFDKLDINKLRQALGNEFVMIMKLHPFIKSVPEIEEQNKDFIINLSSEREINDLLFVSDILITDYSSVCFEYSLLNKPMIFFAYDLEEYIEDRDFYYPFESFVPGPIVRNTDEIIDIIKEEKFDLDKVNEFKNKFFSNLDGNATKKVVNELLKI
ncbi:MAG: CDP-glycerol glycerophosphotransferase family protein [Peptostreptococcaceae bacterium]